MPPKRSLDTFFSPIADKRNQRYNSPPTTIKPLGCTNTESIKDESDAKGTWHQSSELIPFTTREIDTTSSPPQSSFHHTYPFPVPHIPPSISSTLADSIPAHPGKSLNHLPDLDLLYFQPFIPVSISLALFNFLRANLFFYRVKYKMRRGTIETDINTPRFTTVFGVDETSYFSSAGDLLDAESQKPVEASRYKTCRPRPLPKCLDDLKALTEAFTSESYNFCLVNYYANGNDSISYHSDDEKFLGGDPAIASFSLGASRDFLMKHKSPSSGTSATVGKGQVQPVQLKIPLASGDMILMRGSTQSNWLHSIPKRKGKEAEKGRINITFRKAIVRGGTENYYRYNVGEGEIWKWNSTRGDMEEWRAERRC